MIHPDTKILLVNEQVGLGVFATQFIPAGTIVYVLDQLDIIIEHNRDILSNKVYRDYLDKYAYVDAKGNHIVCWDHGKYVNHSCNPNTLSTGYGFEIAIRDIYPGEEITDDYLLLNATEEMEHYCGDEKCRKKLSLNDFELLSDKWDAQIKSSLRNVNKVAQPLWELLDMDTLNNLNLYSDTGERYQSVRNTKYCYQ